MPTVTPLPSPAPVLLWSRRLENQKCDPVQSFDDSLENLFKRLVATCYTHKGVGLAAPQIGEFVRMSVIHWPIDQPAWAIINPVIDSINSKGEQIEHEGCLSIPQANAVRTRVRRCKKAVYSYQDLTGKVIHGEAEGPLARIICHETDHLDGIFYTDRVGDSTRSLIMRSYQKWLERNPNLGNGRYRK